jgi:hypothetical protein
LQYTYTYITRRSADNSLDRQGTIGIAGVKNGQIRPCDGDRHQEQCPTQAKKKKKPSSRATRHDDRTIEKFLPGLALEATLPSKHVKYNELKIAETQM